MRQETAARQQTEAARIVTLDPNEQPADGGEGADQKPSETN